MTNTQRAIALASALAAGSIIAPALIPPAPPPPPPPPAREVELDFSCERHAFLCTPDVCADSEAECP